MLWLGKIDLDYVKNAFLIMLLLTLVYNGIAERKLKNALYIHKEGLEIALTKTYDEPVNDVFMLVQVEHLLAGANDLTAVPLQSVLQTMRRARHHACVNIPDIQKCYQSYPYILFNQKDALLLHTGSQMELGMMHLQNQYDAIKNSGGGSVCVEVKGDWFQVYQVRKQGNLVKRDFLKGQKLIYPSEVQRVHCNLWERFAESDTARDRPIPAKRPIRPADASEDFHPEIRLIENLIPLSESSENF